MFIFLVLVAFSLIAYLEGAPLYRERRFKELVVTGALWSLSLALSLAMLLNLVLPSPTLWMERLFLPVSSFLKQLLIGGM
ncbi:MAG: hypothetical protein L5656_05615 [Thermanaeromonas sp.]|uniref:hypothetical protein n=1 Tax=Thermanaeromonas sp. TaxID=2003697 RepID=UPI00243EDDCF|nr:hypothetical protein [Thermanaeromonas sp.]MCG0277990.1 hypothetical protein [Thermanaeromonas sp.]